MHDITGMTSQMRSWLPCRQLLDFVQPFNFSCEQLVKIELLVCFIQNDDSSIGVAVPCFGDGDDGGDAFTIPANTLESNKTYRVTLVVFMEDRESDSAVQKVCDFLFSFQ